MSEEPEKKECKLCETAFAVFGLILGALFLYVSIDLLTGQRVSKVLMGGSKIIEGEVTDD